MAAAAAAGAAARRGAGAAPASSASHRPCDIGSSTPRGLAGIARVALRGGSPRAAPGPSLPPPPSASGSRVSARGVGATAHAASAHPGRRWSGTTRVARIALARRVAPRGVGGREDSGASLQTQRLRLMGVAPWPPQRCAAGGCRTDVPRVRCSLSESHLHPLALHTQSSFTCSQQHKGAGAKARHGQHACGACVWQQPRGALESDGALGAPTVSWAGLAPKPPPPPPPHP